MTRVLVVTNMYPHEEMPSYGSFVHSQVEALRELGHEVEVFFFPGYRSRLQYFRACWQVWLRTRRKRYDVVHAHYGFSGVPALFSWRTPVVVTYHGSDVLVGLLQPLVSRMVSRLSDANIAVSAAIQQVVGGDYIPCGIDTRRYRPAPQAEARQQLGLNEDCRYVLFPFDPARWVKRHELAVAAVELLQVQGLNVQLLTVHGVTNELMPLYYNAADVLVLTSRSEGSPTCIKEALACEVPVVSVDVGDAAHLLAGVTGSFVCPATPQGVAQGLRQALQVKRADHNGRDAMMRFDSEIVAQAVSAVYRRAISNFSRNRKKS
jgi:glycosyltransferase involved in cell wall biosynthesis